MLFINKVCLALDQAGVRYAIVGGYAVALHGAVRGTMDVDIVINWDLNSLQKSTRALNDIHLVSRLPVSAEDVFQFRDEYIQNRNLIAWNFHNPDDLSQQVDIIIAFDLKGKGRKKLNTRSGALHLLNLADLISMKRESGRPQDLEDVKALESLR
jgi:hypothetical protein